MPIPTLLDLHSAGLVGSYDVALVYKDDDGKVPVTDVGGGCVPSTLERLLAPGLVAARVRAPRRRWVLPSGPHAAGTTHLIRAIARTGETPRSVPHRRSR